MYRVGVFGNNEVAYYVARSIQILYDDIMKLVVIIPEGDDLVNKERREHDHEFWEKSFIDYNPGNGIKKFVGNINNYSKELKELDLDILFGCRSGALVKNKILDIPRIGVTNFHYGDLPRYGGCHTLQHAILNGEEYVGVTFHFMDERFDSGPYISKKIIPIQNKTAFELYGECNIASCELFRNYFKFALEGDCHPQEGERLYFPSDSIDFENDSIISLDYDDPLIINRKLRAFYFPPFQVPRVKTGNLIFEVNNLQIEPLSIYTATTDPSKVVECE